MRRPKAFSRRDQIFPAQLVPTIGLGPLLEKVMGINKTRNPFVLFGLKGEGPANLLAKVGGDECSQPSAAAFGDGDDKRVAAMADTATRKRIADLGMEIPPREQQSPEGLGAFHKAEIEKWWPIIKAANVKPD